MPGRSKQFRKKNYRTGSKGVLNMMRTKRETGRRGEQLRLQFID